MEQLQEQVAKLQAERDQLLQERNVSSGGSSSGISNDPSTTSGIPAAVTERLLVIPRDRKCPTFNGKTGIGITEWEEELRACARARHLSSLDQALFIFDHLDGEAKEEIKFRSSPVREDPEQVLAILKELYGPAQSYVTLQQEFFSRHQREGESLLEFSLALLSLMTQVKQCAPDGMPNADVLLRDQFTEHVMDNSLRRELKQMVRRQPTVTLFELRREAIRWEREGFPGGARGRSSSLPSAYGLQYGVQGRPQSAPRVTSQEPSMIEVMEMLKKQQELLERQQIQITKLTQNFATRQTSGPQPQPLRGKTIICLRCQQPGHTAQYCDGVRVPPRQRANSAAGFHSNNMDPSRLSQPTENCGPPRH